MDVCWMSKVKQFLNVAKVRMENQTTTTEKDFFLYVWSQAVEFYNIHWDTID